MKEQLQQWTEMNGMPAPAIQQKPVQRKQEALTERDWKELMGIGRDTFKRHRGSIRRK